MTRIERVTLIDVVVDKIESAIINGEYPPASKLPGEGELSADFDVSRPAVREALARLRERGYVRTINGRGTFVRDSQTHVISETLLRQLELRLGGEISIDDLYDARRTIEMGTTEMAARRATPEDTRRLHEQIDAMRAGAESDPAAYTAADVGFHLAIAEATHSALYPLLLTPLIDLIVQSMYESVQVVRSGMRSGIAEHEEILALIEAGDPQGAAQLMEAHLDRSRQKHPDSHFAVSRRQG